ncbi:MAG: DUF5130 family protein [Pseudonocardia sp.]
MATGEGLAPGATTDHGGNGRAVVAPGSDELPIGAVVTASGRVSAAEEFEDTSPADHPFTPEQLGRLDEALTMSSRETGLRFSLYLGGLGEDPGGRAAELHHGLAGSAEAVLVAVSPEQRVVEVLTGPAARVRLPDNGAKLAVMSMVASFKEGDLLGGLLSGLRMLADAAGGRHRR